MGIDEKRESCFKKIWKAAFRKNRGNDGFFEELGDGVSLPAVEVPVPMPDVKPPKVEKDIGLEHHCNILKNTGSGSAIQSVKDEVLKSIKDLTELGLEYDRPTKSSIAMRAAFLQAELSTCSKMKVGSVLTDRKFRIISSGFNGSPAGTAHCCERDESVKHTAIRDIHAELNCLSSCRWLPNTDEESYLFITHIPCMACSHAIIASKDRLKISKVFYYLDFSDDEAKYYGSSIDAEVILEESGIKLIKEGD